MLDYEPYPAAVDAQLAAVEKQGAEPFALSLEPQNADLRKRLAEVRQQAARGEPTVPSLMGIEKKINPFLRADSEAMARAVHGDVSNPAAVFAELRRRKDRW